MNNQYSTCQISDNSKIDTKKELSKVANVSHDTIAKVKHIEAKADEETKAKLSTGEVSINQAYQEIKKEALKQKICLKVHPTPLDVLREAKTDLQPKQEK